MEDKLIPGYHYMLLKDVFSDLQENYDWALNNLEKYKKNITKCNYIYEAVFR